MAAHIDTRFGALDHRLAVAVRHALELAVFYPALAPLNDVHLRLRSTATFLHPNDLPAEPPFHRWHELMVDLFGPTPRSPVSPRGGRPNDATRAHLAFAATHRTTAAEHRIVHHLVAAAGTFVVAEATRMSDAIDRWNLPTTEDVVDDRMVRPLLMAGQVGMRLARTAAAGTWPELLVAEDTGSSVVIPGQATRTTTRPDPHLPVPTNPRIRYRGLAVLLVVGVLLAGGIYTAYDQPGRDSPRASMALGGRLERPDLKVSIMRTTDLAAFQLAERNGYFADAGFTFDEDDVRVVDSGTDSVDLLTSGAVDIAYSTYTPFIRARSQGVDVELVSGASSAGPGSCMVVALPDSRVGAVEDLPGKRVAVTARNTMSDLLIMAALRDRGLDHRSIDWVETPFPDMAGKLARGEVDAAFMIEPFLSAAEDDVGAEPVMDTATGPRLDLPTAGFGATAEFVRENPRTVREFQRIMAEATDEAVGADPVHVQTVLRPLIQIDQETARSPTKLTFRSDLDVSGLEEVTTLMQDFDMIPNGVDVPAMIAKVPR